MEFYQKSFVEIAQEFSSNIQQGLSLFEVQKRLKTYGFNKLPQAQGPSKLRIFLKQFINPLMWALLAALLASVVIAHYKDALVIVVALGLTALIGFFQEWKAERALALLKSFEVDYCNVRRAGLVYRIASTEIVPGDLLMLDSGMRIPADVRLTVTRDLYLQESVLTGEPRPVLKQADSIAQRVLLGDQKNMAYTGTFVLGGSGEGIVVAIGKDTYLGKLASLIGETEHPSTPMQEHIHRLSAWLGLTFCVVTLIVSVISYLRGMMLTEVIITGIALAVAAIPESLPVAITVILAVGMRRMIKRKALIRHLIAAETLGSVSVICTDKTGTLTQGDMRVVEIISSDQDFAVAQKQQNNVLSLQTRHLLLAAMHNCDVVKNEVSGNLVGQPTEVALVSCAHELKISVGKDKQFERVAEIPFSSDKKFKATLHENSGNYTLVVKGAPERVFDFCSDNEFCIRLKTMVSQLSGKGLRLLAVATKKCSTSNIEVELHNLTCLGLIALNDPLREHAATTVEQLQQAGITLVVVTGDHHETAVSIANQVGIHAHDEHVMLGEELDEMADETLREKIDNISVFARVEPAHKIKIVKAWRKLGKSVAMVGDGVNDAPALKAADIGVALGSGSDVTHEISDMILLDNNLATISHAVEEGRIIFDNVRKVLVYLLGQGFSEIGFIGLSVVIGLPLPLLAMQIFWLNLITDALPYIALAIDHGEEMVMKRKPFKKDEPILNKTMQLFMAIGSITITAGLMVHYALLLYWFSFELSHIRSILFTALVFDSLLFSFSVRYIYSSWFSSKNRPNIWLFVANSLGLFLQVVVLYVPVFQNLFLTVPLSLNDWILLVCLGFGKILIIEMSKVFFLTSTQGPATILQDKI